MASMGIKIFFWALIIVFVLLVFIEDVQGRRSGSRSSSRSRSRSRPKTPTKSYRNVAMSGRIVKGSKSFASSRAFQLALGAGVIYGSAVYLSRYRHSKKIPPICTNHRDRDVTGKIYGYFICPRETETADKIYCCGPEHREFCCNKETAQRYYSEHYNRKKGGMPVGIIIGIILAIVIIFILVFVCCKKRKHAGQILRRMSSKGDSTMHPPPPAYHATPAGYNSTAGVPYGAPQPQPEFNDSKSGLPPPRVDASAPYPPPDGAPYPPPGGAPYPPPGGPPYPMPGAAPYPAPDDAPYPPPGAPYPYPSSGGPYPPPGDPYPPPGDPYPPPGGPYPPTEAPYPGTAPPYPGDAYPPPAGPPGNAAYDGTASYPVYPPPSQSKI